MTEKNLLTNILLRLQGKTVLFRNNVGRGWAGQLISKTVAGNGFNIVLANARPLHSGLIEGSSDLIGWTPITVTADMVGKKMAVFTAIEIKAGKTTTTKAQANFVNQIKAVGGIAAIVRTVEDAEQIFK